MARIEKIRELEDVRTMSNNLLSIQQATNLLGVSTKTLRRWEKRGVLTPSQRTVGNQRRYLKTQIEAFNKGEPPTLQQVQLSEAVVAWVFTKAGQILNKEWSVTLPSSLADRSSARNRLEELLTNLSSAQKLILAGSLAR